MRNKIWCFLKLFLSIVPGFEYVENSAEAKFAIYFAEYSTFMLLFAQAFMFLLTFIYLRQCLYFDLYL